MKRIALLGFIVFVVPVWIASCGRCGKGSSPGNWTWGGIKMDITNQNISDNDTIITDYVYFKFQLTSQGIAQNNNTNNPSIYTAIACEPSDPTQKNFISTINFALKYLTLTDTILPSLTLKDHYQNYEWPKDKNDFLFRLSSIYDQYRESINGRFLNPHNLKQTQIIMTAIKRNGDTLKAVSKKIFLK